MFKVASIISYIVAVVLIGINLNYLEANRNTRARLQEEKKLECERVEEWYMEWITHEAK